METLRKIDFWCGAGFLVLGGWVLDQSAGFDDASRSYPMFLAVALCLLSVSMMVHAIGNRSAAVVSAEGTQILLLGPGSKAFLWGLWTMMLAAGIGYLGASFVVVAGIVFLVRNELRWRDVISSAGIVLVVFFMFYLIFDVPLPVLDFVEDLIG